MSSQRSAAKGRGLAFLLDKDDALGLYLHQDGKCALSGIKMNPNDLVPVRMEMSTRPSIDRIDSSGGYILSNIQIVCGSINLMKGARADHEFILLCLKVAEAHKKREGELSEFFGVEAEKAT